ncbi:hypothetical protein [Wukongibacter sp. M2B1]|uniref:hypothetical protein n=1 Tax=Wukongibacter sp. M2B1 TaxID=3088895 RepID=UPI003D78FEA3
MKKLVTKSNIEDFLVEGESEFYADSSMIITPGAKDILRNKGIVIVFGERKEECSKATADCQETSSVEDQDKNDNELATIRTIANLLAQEFKITDIKMIKQVTSEVLKRIEK